MSFKRIGHTLRKGRVMTRVLPILVWLVAVGGVVGLYVYRSGSFHVVGIATSQTAELSVGQSGCLTSLPVRLYQEVRKGQPLAVVRLYPDAQQQYTQARFEAEKATATAELDYLKAEAAATEQRLALERSRREMEQYYRDHQLALDVEKARLEILEIRTTLEPLRIHWRDLDLERRVLEDLVARKAVELYELQKIEAQADAMAEQIARLEDWLAQGQKDLESARRRLEGFRGAEPVAEEAETILQPLRKAISVQERRLAELFVPQYEVTLTAPFDGIVAAIFYSEGSPVVGDLPILTVTASSPDRIMAWVRQEAGAVLSPRQPVEIVKTSVPRQILRSEVSEVGPMIELMPERLWADPAVPQWGRPVLILVHPEMWLVPNEQVGVRGI